MEGKQAAIYNLIICVFICAIHLFVAITADAVIAELRKAGTTKTKFSASVGNIVDVDIYINTMGEQIGGVYIYLSFDDKIFELVDITQPVEGGPFLDNWQLMENDTHGDPGNAIPKFQIDYAKVTFAPENSKVGDGVIGTLHLRALKPVVSTQITFDESKFHNRETQCARGAGLKIVKFTNLIPATISVKGALKIKSISDIVFNVGEIYEIDLDDYIDEPAIPDSDITWTVSGNKNIEITIAPDSHVAAFSSPDWTGEETVVFTAEAASGESAVLDATVKVVAPPVFIELPAVRFKSTEKSQRLNLNKYLTDFDDPNLEEIQWNYRGATNINVELSSEGFVTFSGRGGWAGTEEIIIIATDSDGNVAEAPIKVTVIAAPIVSNLPDVTSTIDGTISKPRLILDDYVFDPDNNPDELIWSFSGNHNIEVSIDNATREVTFRSDGWTGAEKITFTATDPDLQSGGDTLTVRLISAENGLVVLDIPDVSFSEWDAPPTLDLNEYVLDLDGSPDEITWTYKGNDKVFISIDPNNIATFSADEIAEELITFTATDADVNRASDQMTVTYIANQPPGITPLPEQVLQGGTPSKIFNLDDFVSDDNTPKDEIKWSASGYDETHLIIVIEVSRNVLVIPAQDWYGTEIATFTAEDAQGNSASGECLIKVTAAPVVTLSGEIKVAEGETDTSLYLDGYVEDMDTPKEQISWEVTTPDETEPLPLIITVDSVSRKVVIYASTGSEGDYAVTFVATDPDGNKDEGTINVKVTKDSGDKQPPVVEDIPDVILSAGKPSATINLNDYVHDADTPPEGITWTASGNSKINVDINDRHSATLTIQEGFSGTGKITFTATDADGNSASDDVTVTVQKSLPPNLKPLPEMVDGKWQIADGEWASELNLDDYVEDEDTPLDKLKWQASDYNQKHTVVKISPRHKVTITAVKEWHGVEEITFTVTDPDGNQASASMQVKFTAPPKVSLPPVLSLAEGEKNTSLNLDDHVTDEDTPLNELNWQVRPGSEKIDVQIDKSHNVTVSALEGSVGEHNVSFIATDADGNSGSGTVVVKVTSEKDNEAPTFTIAVLPNPIQPNYITITVYSSEELNAPPVLTVDEAEVPLTEAGTNLWLGTHILPIEAKNKAIISVLGTDLAGNEGASMKAFTVIQPRPKALTYLKLKSYPNPAVGVDEVTISCEVDAPTPVRMRIYNLAGKLVKTIEVDPLALDSKGYEYHWDMKDSSGERIASGIYFCYAEAVDHDFRITKSWKLAVVR
ncbi:MAG: Ig-like domain-containing protein [Candidatus Poribacteria bacterium]